MCIRDSFQEHRPEILLQLNRSAFYSDDESVPELSLIHILANNVVEIIRPSSGGTSYYKVKDANSLIMTDSLGNEPEGAMAKHYVLTKKR